MKKTLLLSLLGAAVLSMGTANAGGGSLFGGSGESDLMNNIYVGGSIGQATSRCMITYTDEDCDTDGWKVFGGYKFTDNIAAEVGYYNIGSAEEKMTTDSFGTLPQKLKQPALVLLVYTATN